LRGEARRDGCRGWSGIPAGEGGHGRGAAAAFACLFLQPPLLRIGPPSSARGSSVHMRAAAARTSELTNPADSPVRAALRGPARELHRKARLVRAVREPPPPSPPSRGSCGQTRAAASPSAAPGRRPPAGSAPSPAAPRHGCRRHPTAPEPRAAGAEESEHAGGRSRSLIVTPNTKPPHPCARSRSPLPPFSQGPKRKAAAGGARGTLPGQPSSRPARTRSGTSGPRSALGSGPGRPARQCKGARHGRPCSRP